MKGQRVFVALLLLGVGGGVIGNLVARRPAHLAVGCPTASAAVSPMNAGCARCEPDTCGTLLLGEYKVAYPLLAKSTKRCIRVSPLGPGKCADATTTPVNVKRPPIPPFEVIPVVTKTCSEDECSMTAGNMTCLLLD